METKALSDQEILKAWRSLPSTRIFFQAIDSFKAGMKSGFELGKEAGQWVSVEDRLPVHGQAVIVYLADRETVILTSYYNDFALSRVSPEEGFMEHGVTHWQPLPEPPKPGSE